MRLSIHEKKIGLHDRSNVDLRVKWVNNLRKVVSRDGPKNAGGYPVCSDIDLLLASHEQREEAYLRTTGKWVEQEKPIP